MLAVDIQYCCYSITREDGYYNFRTRCRTARDVTWKLIHIGHYDRALSSPGGAAYAFAISDACAGQRTLEWAEHQLLALDDVEAAFWARDAVHQAHVVAQHAAQAEPRAAAPPGPDLPGPAGRPGRSAGGR